MNIIRADGNSRIGMGHVMRCLSIADAMKERPLFVTACGECRQLIEERGYQTAVLPTDYQNMESELPFLESIAAEVRAEGDEKVVFLVDSYQVTGAYLRGLRKLGPVACLEDMGISYPVDLLINYNLYGPEIRYAEGLSTLLGTRYVPLRKEFTEKCEYELKKRVEHVMITTGGGDSCFAAAGFLDAFLKDAGKSRFDNITFHVISGPVNQFAEKLKTGFGGHPRVRIYEKVTRMKDVMCQCDVVLTAAGSTVYEVCSMGIPLICFYFAENQRRGAEALAANTDIVNAGNYAERPENTIERVQNALERCIREYAYRKRLWEQERQLVDGRGAARIAEELRIL